MIGKEWNLPLYIKPVLLIIGLIGLLFILYIAQGILIPLVFAILISILLHPVVNFFVRLRINRLIAIITYVISDLFDYRLRRCPVAFTGKPLQRIVAPTGR